MDTISKKIVLVDNSGQPVKELKKGQTVNVRVQYVPIYKIENRKFSNDK